MPRRTDEVLEPRMCHSAAASQDTGYPDRLASGMQLDGRSTACFESCLSLAKSRVNSVVQGWISSRFWNSRFKRAAFNQGDELS
jgi:hypothetical protein